mmetsp:Transcript_73101/g.136640  ORF Transcript_73101/g.136640 Transcript_73101/m.136640 type:complete len:474 (+) Transcript_73101:87-1508(+)
MAPAFSGMMSPWLWRFPSSASSGEVQVRWAGLWLGGLGLVAVGSAYMWRCRAQWLQIFQGCRSSKPQCIEAIKKQYGLSDHGFMPTAEEVRVTLPAYCRHWEETAARLPELVASKKIHAEVEAWTCVPSSVLHEWEAFSPELRRAYTVLAVVAQGYVWADPENPKQILPRALAVPLVSTSSQLGLPPIMAHAASELWNWQPALKSADLSRIEGYRTQTSLTGTSDEDWFFNASRVCQWLAGPLVIRSYGILTSAAPNDDVKAVGKFLVDLAACLTGMKVQLARLGENCSPDVFWKQLRPLLRGSAGNEDKLPNGLCFEGVNMHGTGEVLVGTTAAQSSAIPVFDAVLGVQHRESDREFLLKMREYMPNAHRQYIELLEGKESLRQVLERWRDMGKAGAAQVIQEYDVAMEKLLGFRKGHWKVVGTHVLAQAAKEQKAAGGEAVEAKGTGGSSLEGFLLGIVRTIGASKLGGTQ